MSQQVKKNDVNLRPIIPIIQQPIIQQPIIPVVQQPAYMVVQQPILRQQQVNCVHGKPLKHGQVVQTPVFQQVPARPNQVILQVPVTGNKQNAQQHRQHNLGSRPPKKTPAKRR
ncbi:hypothetical protein INT47_001511 [Mucor saturninus]|uniref:Uncharacterized protein n=1 Tax=Mucor saturninus TaxID=64648 RepID=A0A8H7R051_9FUNG|nr:hypothetical protein INT47_001511 [Mucor saturninus]